MSLGPVDVVSPPAGGAEPHPPYPPPPPGGGWSPGPQRRGRGRGPLAGGIVVLLVAALLAGWLGAWIGSRNAVSTTINAGGTPVQVNTAPLPAGSLGNAAAVAAKLSPSVGTIVVASPGGSALGSGFVISNNGGTSFLVTNNHVVAGASSVRLIMPSEKQYTATVVGTDSFDDLAVISVQDGNLPVATLGDSTKLVSGQKVIAIGSPLGNVGSVTSGVISALHRTIRAGDQASGSTETLQDVLQTDASINPGNSGGPLADTGGRVIGVNVATSGSATNIGFSIPSAIVQRVVRALIAHQPIRIPFMGIGYLDPVDAATSGQPYQGAGDLVTTVQPGSPADQAGIKRGDVIVSIDGTPLNNGETLGGLVQLHAVGDKLTIVVDRNGQNVTLTLTLGTRPAATG